MSQTGQLVWYSNHPDVLTPRSLPIMMAVLGAITIDDLYSQELHEIEEADFYPESDHLGSHVPTADLTDYYDPNRVLWGVADFASLGDRVAAAITAEIEESVRGTFLPDRGFFALGQDVREDSDDERSPVAMKLCLGVWGYSTPSNGEEMRRQTPLVSEVRAVTRELSRHFDDVKTELFQYY